MKPGRKPTPLNERFWSHVAIGSPDECWEWQSGTNSQGYGIFLFTDRNPTGAHRVAWILTQGAIPDETPDVLHNCDNPPCCNPSHLFLGTRADNNRDRAEKGRYDNHGESNPNHKLTDADIRMIRKLLHNGQSQTAIAARFNVPKQTIWKIAHHRQWQHVTDLEADD